jgi:tRNA dimethylallyltransferase
LTHKKTLIVVIGPTAIGKTALGIAFAKAYKTSIISCDSRQFYREMNIGTAVPSILERAEAMHHFIQNKSIQDTYNAGDFEKEAMQLLYKLFKKRDVVIMVGGSALYEKAITHGLDDLPEIPLQIKKEIQQEFEQKGLVWLQKEVQSVDSVFYKTVDHLNPRRLLRALEIHKATGYLMSDLQNNEAKTRDFNIIKVGLEADRAILYARINRRVDIMLNSGLLQEAKSLRPFKKLPVLLTVGYQELFPFFEGKYDYQESIRLIKRNTRRFAKRQMTWYRKDSSVHWFSYQTRHTEIVQRVDTLMEFNTD